MMARCEPVAGEALSSTVKSTETRPKHGPGRFPAFREEAELQTPPEWAGRATGPAAREKATSGQGRDGPANPPRRGQPLGQQRGGRPPGHPSKRAESGRSGARQPGGIQRQNHHSNGSGQAFRGGAAAAHRARASSSPIWAAGLPGPRWKGKRKSSLLPRLPELTRMTLTGLEVSLMLLLSPAEPPRHRVGGERVEGLTPGRGGCVVVTLCCQLPVVTSVCLPGAGRVSSICRLL